jgi:hypothetical protein
MRKLIIFLLLIAASTAYALPRQQKQRQELRGGGNRPSVLPKPRATVQNAILVFYINQFQKQVEVSQDVFGKILPFVQQFIQERFEISQRRQRALNQLRRAINSGGSEEELRRSVREFDAADTDFQKNQERFLSSVDPFLNPRQQARFRLVQNQADLRLRQMLEEVQNQNAAGQQQPPAATNSPN